MTIRIFKLKQRDRENQTKQEEKKIVREKLTRQIVYLMTFSEVRWREKLPMCYGRDCKGDHSHLPAYCKALAPGTSFIPQDLKL